LTPETSAAPAGLTARARPEARPEMRAANLRSERRTYRKDARFRQFIETRARDLHRIPTVAADRMRADGKGGRRCRSIRICPRSNPNAT
jgi:hypothetical protein